MKRDLTHLLRREEPVAGFENPQEAKEYLARYLLNYINIELEGLPKHEWDKTLTTWAKMCAFAKGLIKKSERERQELYRRFNFDMVMQGIIEDLRNTLIGMLKLDLIREDDPPQYLILRASDMVKDDEELMNKWELNPEIVRYINNFYSSRMKKQTSS